MMGVSEGSTWFDSSQVCSQLLSSNRVKTGEGRQRVKNSFMASEIQRIAANGREGAGSRLTAGNMTSEQNTVHAFFATQQKDNQPDWVRTAITNSETAISDPALVSNPKEFQQAARRSNFGESERSGGTTQADRHCQVNSACDPSHNKTKLDVVVFESELDRTP